MLTKSQELMSSITGLRSWTILSESSVKNLTRTEANLLLDWQRAGKEVPRELIDMALILTGDMCPHALV